MTNGRVLTSKAEPKKQKRFLVPSEEMIRKLGSLEEQFGSFIQSSDGHTLECQIKRL